jgi:hypothetical protein
MLRPSHESIPNDAGRRPAGEEHKMDMMDGMSGAMGGMGLLWFLIVVLVVLGIAALAKYLFGGPKR